MSDPRPSEALRQRYEAIVEALGAAEADRDSADRVALRESIIALFRDTEALIGELDALKQAIRPLVDRYRVVFPSGASEREDSPDGAGSRSVSGSGHAREERGSDAERPGTPRPDGESEPARGSVRVDHLGSST